MNNCLVTKLKGVVDNPDLVKLGSWVMNVHKVTNLSSITQWFNLIDRNDGQYITATIEGDGHFIFGNNYATGQNVGKQIKMKNPTSLIGVEGTGSVYLSNGDYKVIIENKYAINNVCNSACFLYDLDELKYNTFSYVHNNGNNMTGYIKGNLDVLAPVADCLLALGAGNQPYSYGTVKGLFTANKTRLAVPSFNVSGSLNDSKLSSSCTYLDITYNRNITGDISKFGNLVNLTNMYICVGTGISGTIESLVAAFRANGKTSGQIVTQIYMNQNITFNGNPIPSTYNGDPLIWTANTITCNGVTINA